MMRPRTIPPAPGGRTLRPSPALLFFWAAFLTAQALSIQEFPPILGKPAGIAAGPDGAIWLVEESSSRIARMDLNGNLLGEISLAAGSAPQAIVAAADGNLWFTEAGTSKIGKMDRSGALLGEFAVGSPPESIAVGPDGNLWFTEGAANKIGKMDTSGRLLAEFAILTAGSQPRGITRGPCADGNLWFTEQIGRIGRIDTAGNIRESASTGGASYLRGITAGPPGDCNLYVTDRGQDCIVRLSPTGSLGVILLPIGSGPIGIVAGPDGNLWFTENGLNRIGHMTPEGAVGPEVVVPSPSTFPDGIAVGPDANIWFTEAGGNRVGRVLTGLSPPPTPTPGRGPDPEITKTLIPRRSTPASRPFRTP